jgi:hypothetical protein
MDRLRGKVILISGGAHSRAACRSIIWEIWALSVDDREVDSVVVDEGETDELASEVRIGLSAGGRWIRTSGSARAHLGWRQKSCCFREHIGAGWRNTGAARWG